MILKERKIPLLIRKLEARLRRLPPLHPKIPLFNEDLNKRIAGVIKVKLLLIFIWIF
jgi:hypothetical protein